jgi:muramoyltetrapeptide carboxypeptidase
VEVVAASGPVDREKFEAGAAALGSRYDLRYDESLVLARTGYLAGDDAHRLEALNGAIRDPECRAIILARGGYGLTRILPAVDRLALRSHPKPVVGYSDVTALLAVCARVRVAAIHGPMVSDFAGLCEEDRGSFFGLLENPEPGVLTTGMTTLVGGTARGPLLGGNLEVLSRLLGTPLQPEFAGAVLFLEDVGEAPYRVDRLITHLEQAGVLAAAACVVIGDFTGGDEESDGVVRVPTVRDVLVERLGRLTIPVALGSGFGHGERKGSLPYGVSVEFNADAGTLTALEGVVL